MQLDSNEVQVSFVCPDLLWGPPVCFSVIIGNTKIVNLATCFSPGNPHSSTPSLLWNFVALCLGTCKILPLFILPYANKIMCYLLHSAIVRCLITTPRTSVGMLEYSTTHWSRWYGGGFLTSGWTSADVYWKDGLMEPGASMNVTFKRKISTLPGIEPRFLSFSRFWPGSSFSCVFWNYS
jgi:hypothetical protein